MGDRVTVGGLSPNKTFVPHSYPHGSGVIQIIEKIGGVRCQGELPRKDVICRWKAVEILNTLQL